MLRIRRLSALHSVRTHFRHWTPRMKRPACSDCRALPYPGLSVMHGQSTIRFGEGRCLSVGAVAILTLLAAGCGGGQAGGGGPQGFPPAGVKITVAKLTDVEDA